MEDYDVYFLLRVCNQSRIISSIMRRRITNIFKSDLGKNTQNGLNNKQIPLLTFDLHWV